MKFSCLLLRCLLFVAVLFWGVTFTLQGQCRRLRFASPFHNKALVGHVIKNLTLTLELRSSCRGQCTLEDNCVSYNIGPPIKDQVSCQLSDSDHVQHPDDLVTREGFMYQSSENVCSSNPCLHNTTCLNGYTEKGYLCLCQFGYTGKKCKIGTSCSDLLDSSEGNRAYSLKLGPASLPVYCHMSSLGACGGAGWTLVMKIDGTKRTFHYDSNYWSDKNSFNLPGGKTGFDSQETKLPTYWNTPFSKICLGMKVDHQFNFIVINREAESLYSLIADGNYRNTSLARDTWKALIGSQASLQFCCDIEGFNSDGGNAKTRIGIVCNECCNAGCGSHDSRIGFGGAGGMDDSHTCGNLAYWTPDNGDKNIKAMGYIFIQ